MRAAIIPSPVPAAVVRRARYAISTVYAAEALAFSTVMARVPQVQHENGLSDRGIGVLVALVPVLAVAGGLGAARLCGRTGSGLVLRCAQPLFFAAVVLLGAVRGAAPLTAAVALFGTSLGMIEAALNAQAVAIERHEGRSLVNGFFAVFSGMSIAGSLWGALANRLGLSLAAGFLVPALVGLAVAVATTGAILSRARENPLGPAAERARARAAALGVPWRPLLVLGALLAAAYVAEGGIAGFAVKYVRDELGGADAVAPLALTAFAAATVTGRALADRVVRRRGAAWLVRRGALVAALGLAAAAAAPGPWPAIAGFAAAGFGLCAVAPCAYAAAARHDPVGQGVAVARVGVFNYAGAVAGTGLAAAVAPVSGYWVCYLASAAFVLVLVPLAGRFEPAAAVPAAARPAASESA